MFYRFGFSLGSEKIHESIAFVCERMIMSELIVLKDEVSVSSERENRGRHLRMQDAKIIRFCSIYCSVETQKAKEYC